MQRRHGSERIASQETVQRRPAGLPELLAVLDHHPAQLGRPAVLHQALRRRRTRAARSGSPSSRSVRCRTSRRSARRRAGSAPGGAGAGKRRSRAGTGTTASATTRAPSPRRGSGPGWPSARCSRSVGVVPSADRLVDAAPGSATLHPPLERLRIVVGHLVGGDVGPHLQHARRRRRACASAGRARRGRTGPRAAVPVTTGGGSFSRRRASGAATRRRAPHPRPRGWRWAGARRGRVVAAGVDGYPNVNGAG